MRNGIVLDPTSEGSQAKGHLLLNPAQELTHNLIGIATVLMDFRAGMATAQAVHTQADARTVNCVSGSLQTDGCPGTTCAGNGKYPLLLGIQIDHGSALEHGNINGIGTQQAHFLVHGDNYFQRRMGNGFVRQQSHSKGNCNSVIAAQGRTLCEDRHLIMGDIQSLGSHVQLAVRVLIADHIHVSLKNHRCMVFHTTGAISKQNHIVYFILNVLQALLFGKRDQIVTDHFGIPGAMGNRAQLFKITKYGLGLQPGQLYCFHNTYLLIESGFILAQR